MRIILRTLVFLCFILAIPVSADSYQEIPKQLIERMSLVSYDQKAGLNAYVLGKYYISSYRDPSLIPNNRLAVRIMGG